MADPSLSVRREQGVALVSLRRLAVRNALDGELIEALHDVFDELSGDASVRAIVLTGDGAAFCGGADVTWMRASLALTRDENVAEARALSRMYRAIDRCPKPVIARVHGAALGGGAGLIAVSDVAVAADDTIFGFTETKLGLLPAVISPFVLAKIGRSHARALFLTGERFDAKRALAIGLVHEVVAPADLDAAVARIVAEMRSAGPRAVARGERVARADRGGSV